MKSTSHLKYRPYDNPSGGLPSIRNPPAARHYPSLVPVENLRLTVRPLADRAISLMLAIVKREPDRSMEYAALYEMMQTWFKWNSVIPYDRQFFNNLIQSAACGNRLSIWVSFLSP